MKKYILPLITIAFISNGYAQKLSRKEATDIIKTSYKFKKCNTAVSKKTSYIFNEKQKRLYDFKSYSMVTRAVVATSELKEIIGISISEQDRNKATVLFTTKFKKTPFYAYKNHKRFDEPSNCSSLPEKEVEVTMIKYDTGWRIKK